MSTRRAPRSQRPAGLHSWGRRRIQSGVRGEWPSQVASSVHRHLRVGGDRAEEQRQRRRDRDRDAQRKKQVVIGHDGSLFEKLTGELPIRAGFAGRHDHGFSEPFLRGRRVGRHRFAQPVEMQKGLPVLEGRHQRQADRSAKVSPRVEQRGRIACVFGRHGADRGLVEEHHGEDLPKAAHELRVRQVPTGRPRGEMPVHRAADADQRHADKDRQPDVEIFERERQERHQHQGGDAGDEDHLARLQRAVIRHRREKLGDEEGDPVEHDADDEAEDEYAAEGAAEDQ
ncbi:hypothetical protein WR25_12125 [Diploscapter pachys]|uniref:Uncharacterized protein n=1 Tax=Diploscapter pachys TaxID=2018661 RepID=A0A2A2JXI3_9BILA|nr:hypothetical protein WR25_12125 [Diploscapter pachys]